MHDKDNRELITKRRIRLHQLVLALINQQGNLELIDDEAPNFQDSRVSDQNSDPAQWIDRNRRILKRYQALVRSAVTIDALLDAEQGPEG